MTQRLIDFFQPEHYDLYLDIDRHQKQITGKTTIQGQALQQEIFLNQKYLKHYPSPSCWAKCSF